MIKGFFLAVILCLSSKILAQDSIKLLFVYGSRPIEKHEDAWFGGIHGGHVSVSYLEGYVSFVPNDDVQIFRKNTINSKFTIEYGDQFVFDTSDSRYLIISIPTDSANRSQLDSVIRRYLNKSPYPYAFFGMRCASAAADLLQVSSILPATNASSLWRQYFYPRKLRRQLIKLARQNAWPMIYRSGRTSRRWESD